MYTLLARIFFSLVMVCICYGAFRQPSGSATRVLRGFGRPDPFVLGQEWNKRSHPNHQYQQWALPPSSKPWDYTWQAPEMQLASHFAAVLGAAKWSSRKTILQQYSILHNFLAAVFLPLMSIETAMFEIFTLKYVFLGCVNNFSIQESKNAPFTVAFIFIKNVGKCGTVFSQIKLEASVPLKGINEGKQVNLTENPRQWEATRIFL